MENSQIADPPMARRSIQKDSCGLHLVTKEPDSILVGILVSVETAGMPDATEDNNLSRFFYSVLKAGSSIQA